jgi:hypothetical protein
MTRVSNEAEKRTGEEKKVSKAGCGGGYVKEILFKD